MKRPTLRPLICVLVLSLAAGLPTARGALVYTVAGDVSPSDLSTWSTSNDSWVGYNSAGTLTLSGGQVSSRNGLLGYLSTGIGVATISGSGSSWGALYNFTVGEYGKGTLRILNGARVSNGYDGIIGNYWSSTGTVFVDGAGSKWNQNGSHLVVGQVGSGRLDITNGGAVAALDTVNPFDEPTIYVGKLSSGTVNVDGAGSTLSSDLDAYLGYYGSGYLNISNGGLAVVARTTYLAYNSGAKATINFSAGGGTLTTGSLAASLNDLRGAGTINSHGLISDTTLIFGAGCGASATIPLNSLPNQNIQLTIDLSSSAKAGDLGAGWRDLGALTIQDGITVFARGGYLGHASGATGTATVCGAGSTWICSNEVQVGCGGRGILSILNGGTVSNVGASYLGYGPGSAGTVTVKGANSKYSAGHYLYVGGSGSGSLRVISAGSVSDGGCYVGYDVGSRGTVTVDGAGSTWTNGGLYVGCFGAGVLRIASGGSVSDSSGRIGYNPSSAGAVTVAGSGSTWTTSGSLSVGDYGQATLSITGGGAVTAGSVSIGNSLSLLAIDVGRGSSLAVGSGGTLTNNGKLRFLAGAGVPAGVAYSPISAGTWGGTGTFQAIGGTFSTTTHQFTASSVTTTTSGSATSVNLASAQRVLVSDGSTGWTLGKSFLATLTASTLTCSATPISGGTLSSLGSSLGSGGVVLGGWTLAATSGYTAGDPLYLSFGVGAGRLPDDLAVWQYSTGSWSPYDAPDLTYDGTYASFTTAALGVYAVSVPEPSALALVAVAMLGSVAFALRPALGRGCAGEPPQPRRRQDV
jgi:T5SS/PEP-CTERM-associated repeat protein